MSKNFFVQFWFCAFSETTKSCLTLKIIPSNLPGKILSFESISVVISQKLSELDQFNIGPFLFPRTVVPYVFFLTMSFMCILLPVVEISALDS